MEQERLNSLIEQNKIDDAIAYLVQFDSDSDAVCKLGWIHEHHKHDLAAALVCYKRAAEMKNPVGMYSAGFVLLEEGNHAEAMNYLEAGAALDNPKCLLLLATIFMQQSGNEKKALEYCTKSANLGEVNAQVLLGTFYTDGELVERNEEQAKTWFLRAAEAGNSEAQFQLSLLISNKEEAEIWLERAAGQGHSTALYELAMKRLSEQGNLNEAVRLLTYSCEEGNPVAMFEMFKIFSQGIHIEPNEQISFKWCISAAMQGHRDAMFHLGKRLLETDHEKEALEWLQKGVECKDLNSIELLGNHYCKNPQTLEQGVALLQQAAHIRQTTGK